MKSKITILLALAGCALVAEAAPRPNIVYFFADDLGWGGIKANQTIATAQGKNMTQAGKMVTPNIDSIVSAGINFPHSYGNPVCSPSRSCQQTGFHQGHTWADRNDPGDDKAMRTQDPTLGKLLESAGYRNGMYGKWGYGASSNLNNPQIVNEQTLPEHHGYHDCLVELHHVRAHTFNQPSLWYSFIDDDGTLVTDTTLRLNDNTYPQLKYSTGKYYVDDLYAEAAKDFIKAEITKQKASSEPNPFFAQVSFQVPHSPFDDIQYTVDGWFDDYASVDTSSWTAGMKRYAAMVTLMDKRIGEIIDLLEDPDGDPATDDSVLDNTLIIFASDNGGANDSAPQDFNINGHLNKVKGHIYEGGIRVPLAISWQGVIAPGQTNWRRVCVTDILPTFCDLAGIDAPVGLDGTSFASLLTGEGTLRERPWLAYEDHNNSSWNWALIKDNYKLIQYNGGSSYYLYKLDTDDDESQNRSSWASEQTRKAEMLAIAEAENLNEGNLYANVWPTWIGENEADINAAGSWQETGIWPEQPGWDEWPQSDSPEENWNAVVNNPSSSNRTVFLDSSIETLGFELAGNPTNGANLELTLDPGISIAGRNEIRLSRNSVMNLNGGILSSTRFLDIREGAQLVGVGTIDSTVYNNGILDLTPSSITSTNVTIIPGSGSSQSITVDGAANSTEVGTSDFGTFTPTALVQDNVSASGTIEYTISDLTLNGNGGDSAVVTFTVTGHGELLQVKADNLGTGWISAGGTTLNANGEYVQIDLSSLNVYLDGNLDAVSSTAATFDGFTQAEVGGWGSGDTAVMNGIAQAYVNGTANKIFDFTPGGNDTNLLAKFDTSLGAAGTWRPEGWDFEITLPSTPSDPITNITYSTVNGLTVSNDYHQSGLAELQVEVNTMTSLVVIGTATLSGRLECSLPSGFTAVDGDRFPVLSATSVSGTFSNPDGMTESGGHHFRIHYSANQVELEKVAVTSQGTPHWWLEEHGLTNESAEAEALLDTDGDGLSAWEEYIAGTLPDLFSSTLKGELDAQTLETNHVIRWDSVSGRIYNVSGATNLATGFQPLESAIPATPPENAYTTTAATTTGFYRIKTERE